jgi:LacI family transcriptional regulator
MLAAESLLAHADKPTAIFASNDDMAAGVVSSAQRLGIKVPDDLSVVGFDDTMFATAIWPQLTTVRQPIADMAAESVHLLSRFLRARDGEGEREDAAQAMQRNVVLDVSIISRGSLRKI